MAATSRKVIFYRAATKVMLSLTKLLAGLTKVLEGSFFITFNWKINLEFETEEKKTLRCTICNTVHKSCDQLSILLKLFHQQTECMLMQC